MNNIIIIVPIFNEKKNIEVLFKKLNTINIGFDLLFIEDNSSDGSREIIKNLVKNNQNINCIFRPKKMGVGSAHKDGFIWAYKKNYKIIITMDADGTHDPKYIKFLIEELENCDIVITSRFLKKNLLKSWPLQRIFLTRARHVLISLLLSISYDASGAFRCINCERITLSDLILAKNNGYAYFWESVFILHRKKYHITEIPIHLPSREFGSSKMTVKDVFISVSYLTIVFLKKILGKYNFK
jgi:dolichol-phosphate mannosyltransferase